MDELNALGFGADIDDLERRVASMQESAALGEPEVADDVYDQHFKLLKQLRPDSYVVNRNWESDDVELDDNDELLGKYGMASITTMKSFQDMGKFRGLLADNFENGVDLHVAFKLNGHGVRAVYRYGKLVGGSTRGRTKKGRDITKHLKAVLPNEVARWANERIVEVRGELLVSLDNFQNQFATTLKTPLSAVTSLVRDSVTSGELKYLDMLCYKIYTADDGNLALDSLSSQYKELAECGFKVPYFKVYSGVGYYNLEDIVDAAVAEFEEIYGTELMPYYCDGLVATVDNAEQFNRMGYDGKNFAGNMAIKMGQHWGVSIYTSTIIDVEFVSGKKYLTPKAKIVPVRTNSGPEVSTVPLYNVGVMSEHHLVPGSQIHFTFGGETGVTLVDASGRMIGDR